MNHNPGSQESQQTIRDEIAQLERQLEEAKARLLTNTTTANAQLATPPTPHYQSKGLSSLASSHFLYLLSDSALPLGSFAFSSGLESYLAHAKANTRSKTTSTSSTFPHFLSLSLVSYASTTLPFVLAAYRSPARLPELDDAQDAAVMCTVGRRASVAQGRALMGIWDRSFSSEITARHHDEKAGEDGNGHESSNQVQSAVEVLKDFSKLLRASAASTPTENTGSSSRGDLPLASAHLAPLFGVISRILGMSIEQTAYVFMLSHVKALLSAAVRASMFGPYHAQKVLAGREVQEGIRRAVEENWEVQIEEAGQSVPVMDLWIGRHEMLYSRIFNS